MPRRWPGSGRPGRSWPASTNLFHQFATGLVGTRSPYGAVRSAGTPGRISGGIQLGVGGRRRARPSLRCARHGHRRLLPCARGPQRHRWRGAHPRAHPPHWGRACLLGCWTVLPSSRGHSTLRGRQFLDAMASPDGIDPLATLLDTRPRVGGWDPCGGERDRRSGHLLRVGHRPDGGRRGSPSRCPGSLTALVTAGHRCSTPRCRGCGPSAARSSPSTSRRCWRRDAAVRRGVVAERYAAVGEHIAAREELIGDTLDPVVATTSSTGPARRGRLLRRPHAARRARGVGCDGAGRLRRAAHPDDDRAPHVRGGAGGPGRRQRAAGPVHQLLHLLDLAAVAVPCGTVGSGPFGITLTRACWQRRPALRRSPRGMTRAWWSSSSWARTWPATC